MKNNMKHEIKKIPLYFIFAVIIVVISIILGTASMLIAFSLPLDNITKNVIKSSEVLYTEGEDYSLTSLCMSRLDNFTDAIMLANAAYDGNEPLIDRAINVYMNDIDSHDVGRVDALYHYYHNNNEFSFSKAEYARYWHGYLVILKPLLMIMDYSAIRVLNIIIQTLLNATIVLLMFKKKLSSYIIPYLLSICFIVPAATAMSMQYATIFYIFAFSLIAMLVFEAKLNSRLYIACFFTVIGVLVAFFDFLTYPIATFGMAATLYCCIIKNDSLNKRIFDGAIAFSCWGIGYAGMWVGKWLTGSLLTGKNLFASSAKSVEQRISHSSGRGEFSVISVLGKNILTFIKTPITILAAIFIAVMIFIILHKAAKKQIDFKATIPFIIIALTPIAWYVFAQNHSFLHYRFTYKALIASAFSGMCMFSYLWSNRITTDKDIVG